MTSVAPSIGVPQASNSAQQAVAPSSSPSTLVGGNTTAQAAGSASPKNSLPAKSSVNPQLNGRVSIHPAVPATNSPTIIGDQQASASAPAAEDFGRRQSVTISASGTQGYTPNGVSNVGKTSTSSNIQFGSMATNASPQMTGSSPQLNPSSDPIAIQNSPNPRLTSPQPSPSPIPQPLVTSGGKPPSALHGHNNSVNSLTFGGFAGQDGNVGPLVLQS